MEITEEIIRKIIRNLKLRIEVQLLKDGVWLRHKKSRETANFINAIVENRLNSESITKTN